MTQRLSQKTSFFWQSCVTSRKEHWAKETNCQNSLKIFTMAQQWKTKGTTRDTNIQRIFIQHQESTIVMKYTRCMLKFGVCHLILLKCMLAGCTLAHNSKGWIFFIFYILFLFRKATQCVLFFVLDVFFRYHLRHIFAYLETQWHRHHEQTTLITPIFVVVKGAPGIYLGWWRIVTIQAGPPSPPLDKMGNKFM